MPRNIILATHLPALPETLYNMYLDAKATRPSQEHWSPSRPVSAHLQHDPAVLNVSLADHRFRSYSRQNEYNAAAFLSEEAGLPFWWH